MEKLRQFDSLELPQRMERFLLLGEEQGVNTYHMKIIREIKLSKVTWFGYFPNGLGPDQACIAGGGLNDPNPLLRSDIAGLVQSIDFFPEIQSLNMAFNLGGKSDHPQPTEFTPEMPSVGFLFLPKNTIKNNQEEMVFFRMTSNIEPKDALKAFNEAIFDISLN